MMDQVLLDAIQTSRTWLDQFTRKTYTKAFRTYTETYGPAYMEAVRQADGEEGLNGLAGDILDGLEQGWKRCSFWSRGSVKVNEKQMMVDYLSPMLLGLEEPGCARLAELLRDGWRVRWPRNGYDFVAYQEIQNGFRNSILGIDLANKHIDPELDK